MGSFPPGLISLSVAHTAMHRGFRPAWILGLGASLAEYGQALAAIWFANWFLEHPAVETAFRWAAAPIFLGLGLFLTFWAKPPKPLEENIPVYGGMLLVRGALISAFNLLAIPYWIAYCGWLKVSGYWEDGLWQSLGFAAGVTIGTQLALTLYAWLGQEMVRRSDTLARWANKTVGVIFLGLGLKLIWDLLRG
jgi:threonine/homoserine/homoserine lactone efflux protein